MITKKEFKELNIEKQLELVNNELLSAKGTKLFGKYELDFSYGFARSILTLAGYDTLQEENVDGTKVKIFRKMNEDELIEKENKKNTKEIINPLTIDTDDMRLTIALDMFEANKTIDRNDSTIRKSLPIFENTLNEFNQLLDSEEFKVYDKKFVIELMIRNFINKYKKD